MAKDATKMEKIVALCKRRGFIFQSSEIYGGINGFWDYGPLGCELKRNIKEAWWQDMVRNPPVGPDGREVSMVGVDCSIIMNPKVWEASGHATGFADPMVDCKECKTRNRADKTYAVAPFHFDANKLYTVEVSAAYGADLAGKEELWGVVADSPEEAIEQCKKQIEKFEQKWKQKGDPIAYSMMEMAECNLAFMRCPNCQKAATLTPPRAFNLMFKTFIGALEDSSAMAWLRPETAQGIFANFKNVCDSTRVKVPFGIAQMGKAFRNEINPRNYTFRSREFEQMEIEFFCHDKDSLGWWEFWRDVRINWYKGLGLQSDHLRPRNQTDKELAHYSKACTDIEYMFAFADEPQELEGVAHRGCFDLTQHQQFSGKDLSYFDDETRERFVPTVIEPSAGADRAALAFLCEAYMEDPSRASPEIMRFHPRLAPIKAAVFPLVNKDGLPEIAEPIYREIKKHYPCQYDAKAAIGKRYARMDEAGTPFCFTVDGQSKEDGTVTVRDRNTAAQERIDKSRCLEYLTDRLRAGGLRG